MSFNCKSCWSKMEPSAQVCGQCGSSVTCDNCQVNLPPDKKRYALMSRSGCLVYERNYCKECYKAKLIERATWDQIDKEARKTARARCENCKKPFTGIFRKSRHAVKGHGVMPSPTEYFCKDCFLALPKGNPWASPPERITSDPSGESFFD